MPEPLDPLRLIAGTTPIATQSGTAPTKTADGKSFTDVLNDYVKQVDQTQQQVDTAYQAVLEGQTDNLHQVMIAQQKAQLSLKLAVEVRNKLVDAYKETMRTQF